MQRPGFMLRLRRAAPLLVLGAFAVNAALMLWLDEVHAPQRKAEEQAWCDAHEDDWFCMPGFDPFPRAAHLAADAAVLLAGAFLAVWGAWLDRTGHRPWAGVAALVLGGIALWNSREPPGMCLNDDCFPDPVAQAVLLLGAALIVLCALAFFLGPARPAARAESSR